MKKIYFLLPILTICYSCQQKIRKVFWENAPVVAKNIEMSDGRLIDFDPTLLRDTIIFPISYFMDEIKIVKLDDRDKALVSPSQKVLISDNHILVMDNREIPCKLFDKEGHFISNLGSIGVGPGEYTTICHIQIDENNKRIYLCPEQTETILVYDLTGKALEPIKLPQKIREANFRVRGDKVEIVCAPEPYRSLNFAWIQTFSGEVIDSIPTAGIFFEKNSFPRIHSNYLSDSWSVSFPLYDAMIDSVYYVDFKKMKLIPCFTMGFGDREIQVHQYREWPYHFVGSTSEIITTMTYAPDGAIRNITKGDEPKYYIVDKKTLKGAYIQIENDYFGGLPTGDPVALFDNGYYIRNMDPANLADWLDIILQVYHPQEKIRRQLADVLNNITEDDNNYILYAKMK